MAPNDARLAEPVADPLLDGEAGFEEFPLPMAVEPEGLLESPAPVAPVDPFSVEFLLSDEAAVVLPADAGVVPVVEVVELVVCEAESPELSGAELQPTKATDSEVTANAERTKVVILAFISTLS